MLDPAHEQLLRTALSAPDPSAWCNQHRARIDGDFILAARQELEEALQSGTGEAFALADLVSAAAPMVEFGASPDLFTRLSEGIQRSKATLDIGDFSHSQMVFE